jgi:hypothetical protein
MKRLLLMFALAFVILPNRPALGYRWYHVAVDTVDHPTYEIEFGGDGAYVGTEAGVFRGYGLYGGWEGIGLEYPGLGAYSILYRQGGGWRKNVINALPLGGATGVGIGELRDSGTSGYPDIVVAAKEPSDAVVWFENPLSEAVTPTWAVHPVDPIADGAREVAIADIDQDGDLDIAAALRDEDRIVWYENNLASPTDPWIMYQVGALAGPRGVYVADINDDQRPDIVAGGMNDCSVWWFEAPEQPTDPWPGYCIDDSLCGVKGVFAHDMDRDGLCDVVAAGRDADDVVWYEQGDASDPQAWTKHFIDTELPGAVSVWCGDLTGDTRPDVAVTAKLAGWVVVYEQTDDSDVWLRTIIDTELPEACPVSGADIDGDGQTDVVAAGKAAQTVAWYKAPTTSGLCWQKHVVDAAAGHSMGLTTGDLDNDGDAEIIATACPEGLVTVYWNDLREILCAFSDGSGLCESDGIYRWHDASQEWSAVFWCPRPYFIEEHPLSTGWHFCGNHDGLFSSWNLNEWYELGAEVLPDTVRCIWFHPSTSNIMMVGTSRGMYRTTDLGLNWDLVNDEVPPLPGMDIEIAVPPIGPPLEFTFATLGMGSFSDGVFRSDDHGDNWQRLNVLPNPTDLLQDHTWEDPLLVGMFVGTRDGGIHRMDYEGGLVGNLNVGLPDLTIHRMCYDPYIDTPAIFACTQGGLFECMLLELSEVESGSKVGIQMCRAWPNPSPGNVMFSLKGLSTGEEVELGVFDLAGRKVWSRRGFIPGAGPLLLQWDGKNERGVPVASGTYFYRVRTRGEVQTGKVVRVK